MRRPASWALALLGLVVLADPALAQCAMCKATLTASREGQAISRQLNDAILLMVCAPYVVFASVAAVVLRSKIRRSLRSTFSRFSR